MVVVSSVRTAKVRFIRTFNADGPEKMFVLSKIRVTVICLIKPNFFFTGLNAWPTICPANVRTNELFILSEFILTRFDCN